MRQRPRVLNSWFRHLYARARGGTAGFNEAEMSILSFVLARLSEPDRTTLAAQIQAVDLVQRQQPGRLVVAYYRRRERVAVLPYSEYEYCLAKVKYLNRGKARTTSLVLHDGRFMSFERNVPESEEAIESLLSVEFHPGASPSVAKEIDRVEHANDVV
jgi:hypothetical protein